MTIREVLCCFIVVAVFALLASACTVVADLPQTGQNSAPATALAMPVTLPGQPTPACPPAAKTVELAPQYYGRAAGGSPVWAIFNQPELVFSMRDLQNMAWSEHGYQHKVLWVIEPSYSGKVNLQGSDLATGKPLWFQFGGQGELATTPVLDTLNPGAYSNPDYYDYPSYLFLPGPGCYFIQATWDEGSWTINLSVAP